MKTELSTFLVAILIATVIAVALLGVNPSPIDAKVAFLTRELRAMIEYPGAGIALFGILFVIAGKRWLAVPVVLAFWMVILAVIWG